VSSVCQAIEDRLLEGEKLAGHPELVEHVGSCLECFRTMSELRELPPSFQRAVVSTKGS